MNNVDDIEKALTKHAAQERKRALFRCVLWVVFLPIGFVLFLIVLGVVNNYLL